MSQKPKNRELENEDVDIDEIPPIAAPVLGLVLIYTVVEVGFSDPLISLAFGGAGVAMIAAFSFKTAMLYKEKGAMKAIDYAITPPVDREEDYSIDLKSSSGIEKTEKGVTLDHIRSINYQDFEDLVAKVWENKGYETKVVPDGGGDGGIDVVAEKDDINNTEKVLIQAKRYSAGNKVNPSMVREYYALADQESNVDKVYIVTSSSFTKDALDKASKLNVKTVNGKEFLDQYQKYVE